MMYDGKYGRCFFFVVLSYLFGKDVFFFLPTEVPDTFEIELGPKKSMKKGSKFANAWIWYVQASQMDPIQRNSMEVGVLVESFAVFWRLFMAFEP